MALSATIHKVTLSVADMDRHYYQQHELTMAKHPSETDIRFVVRLIAFALNATDELVFTKGLSTDDEPDIWQKSLSGELDVWIELGQVDEKRIRQACGRSRQVIIYTYHQGKSSIWWSQIQQKLARHNNLQVYSIDVAGAEALVSRTMQLQCNIDDGMVYLSDDAASFTLSVTSMKSE
ncbi:MAG: YaeQ family protein [Granulosicoccus sp.]|nr:YaeQ family protein [Granulosicoccus sp.]